ncbi:MAG: nucleotidyl transferase AbiEii/AbiGii toxin family protein [Candidatus Eisenbacteria sp.]|nr:nucleotidyl transferase AbiEii/AbiGii toxin family protein [Candidatus Eisenbacteria bacterium]
MTDPTSLRLHDDLALFREATRFTAAQTGFSARLIEKDYFCTVLLEYLARSAGEDLVFKGGTCLAKVHGGFYRLSEDLDFTIPLAVTAGRAQRRQSVAVVKDAIASVADHLPEFGVARRLTGSSNSTQYIGSLRYTSPATDEPESILIEVSLREPLLTPASQGLAKTILLDPFRGQPMLPDIPFTCISLAEAMAEKLRAALSRRDVAIRDFYDLHYAVVHLGLDPSDGALIQMVRQKLAIPGNPPVDLSHGRLAALHKQLDTRLRPVIRDRDLREFDLDCAIGLVAGVARHLV